MTASLSAMLQPYPSSLHGVEVKINRSHVGSEESISAYDNLLLKEILEFRKKNEIEYRICFESGGLSGVSQPVMLLLWMNVVKMEHVLSIKPQHKLKLHVSFIRVVTITLKLGNLTDKMHVLNLSITIPMRKISTHLQSNLHLLLLTPLVTMEAERPEAKPEDMGPKLKHKIPVMGVQFQPSRLLSFYRDDANEDSYEHSHSEFQIGSLITKLLRPDRHNYASPWPLGDSSGNVPSGGSTLPPPLASHRIENQNKGVRRDQQNAGPDLFVKND
ncbi:hypothetical protein GH733_013431, partial [Mirounga leonina]